MRTADGLNATIANIPVAGIRPISKRTTQAPKVNRTMGAGTLDLDQLAAVLARILEL